MISKNRLTPFADPARQLESLLHKRGIDTVLVPLRLTISSVPIKRCGRRLRWRLVSRRGFGRSVILLTCLSRGRQSKLITERRYEMGVSLLPGRFGP